MILEHSRLAFDAAVSIEMATSAPFGWYANLVGAVRVGTGLGRPIAGAASKSMSFVMIVRDSITGFQKRADGPALFCRVETRSTNAAVTTGAGMHRVGTSGIDVCVPASGNDRGIGDAISVANIDR